MRVFHPVRLFIFLLIVTGKQAINTINGLQDELDNKSNVGHNHDDLYYRESEVDILLAGKANSIHTHTISQVTGLQIALDTKANINHTHIIANIEGLQTALDSKSNIGHTHIIDDVTGLQTALNGKSNVGHNHDDLYYRESEVDTLLAGKANTIHNHTISQVTGLQTTLDGKANLSHTHEISQVNGLQTVLDGKQATLISGTNIKTINNQSILGSGNIEIIGGSVGDIEDFNISFSEPGSPFVPSISILTQQERQTTCCSYR